MGKRKRRLSLIVEMSETIKNVIGERKYSKYKEQGLETSRILLICERNINSKARHREIISFVAGAAISSIGYISSDLGNPIISRILGHRFSIAIFLIVVFIVYWVMSNINAATNRKVYALCKNEMETCLENERIEQLNEENKALMNQIEEVQEEKLHLNNALAILGTYMREIVKMNNEKSSNIKYFCNLLVSHMLAAHQQNAINLSVAIYEMVGNSLWMPGYLTNQLDEQEPVLFGKQRSNSNTRQYGNYFSVKSIVDDKNFHILKNRDEIINAFHNAHRPYSQYGNYCLNIGCQNKRHRVLIEIISYDKSIFADEKDLEKYFLSFFSEYIPVLNFIFQVYGG